MITKRQIAERVPHLNDRVGVRLSERETARIEAAAAEAGVTKSQLIRLVILDWLDAEDAAKQAGRVYI